MESIKPYLYIVIGIVWLIYNAYKNMQKKSIGNPEEPSQKPTQNNTDSVPQATPEKEADFKTILEEILMGKPTITPQPILEKIPPPLITQEIVKSKNKTSRQLKTIEVKPPLSSLERSRGAVNDQATNSSDFDIRQAIIYSEILKRPEY